MLAGVADCEVRRYNEPARESRQKVIGHDVKELSDYRATLRLNPIALSTRGVFLSTTPRTTPQRMCTPEIAREMIKRWISEVPSKIV
jgi:hypothetical protein